MGVGVDEPGQEGFSGSLDRNRGWIPAVLPRIFFLGADERKTPILGSNRGFPDAEDLSLRASTPRGDAERRREARGVADF